MGSIISFEEVSLGYPNFTAIENFSCKIKKGEIVTFFGPSGCGKSTIMKSIMGILKPSKGRIIIDGFAADNYPSTIAYTPQDNQLLPWLTLRENVSLWQKESTRKSNNYSFNAEDALRMVSLADKMDHLPNQISGGMARRTALARCMATQSAIMCLDEALVAVERKFRKNVMVTMRDYMKKQDITTLVISHDYEEAVYMSDTIYILSPSPAEITHVINVDELLSTHRTIDTFEEVDFINTCKKLIH